MDFFATLMHMSWLNIEPAYLVFLLGLIIVIVTLMRQISHRTRENAKKQRQREAALTAAQEAERKRQTQIVVPKSKVTQPQTRVPLGDSLGTPFVGNIQGIAAKWESEIHQIGRQIIGQIDSKMSALQAITLEANRTANRLEILVEHLEEIARRQIEWQQSQIAKNAETEPAKTPSTVISATEAAPAAVSLNEVLEEIQDLSKDLDGIHKTIKRSTAFGTQPESVKILRLAELQAEAPPVGFSAGLRGEVEMLSNYGLEPEKIAQRLNISPGEVDIMLQVQQNQTT